MPAHPKAFARLADHIRKAKTCEDQDRWLDIWLDYRDNATEWDADQWGLEAANRDLTLPRESP
jgi:hypothetical protein